MCHVENSKKSVTPKNFEILNRFRNSKNIMTDTSNILNYVSIGDTLRWSYDNSVDYYILIFYYNNGKKQITIRKPNYVLKKHRGLNTIEVYASYLGKKTLLGVYLVDNN